MPDGIYPFRVTDGEEIVNEAEGKITHKFELTCQHGEFTKRKVWVYFSASSEKHIPYLRLFYELLGITDLSDIEPSDAVTKPIRCEVFSEEYNGKTSNKVRIGGYFEWDGDEDTAWGDGEAPPKEESKPEKKKDLFSNDAQKEEAAPAPTSDDDGDEPPF